MRTNPLHPLAALLASACLLLSACDQGGNTGTSTPSTQTAAGGGAGGGGKKLTVGFSQIGAESGWRSAETTSIRSEAEKRGVNLKYVDAQQKQENQIKALDTFIVQGVDAIILAPVVETGWEPVLTKAKQAKIPVILVDRGVTASPELYTTLIASDFVAEGRMAGEWLAKKTNGKANIAQLEGTTGAAPANDRKKGFVDAIGAHPEMKIIRSQSGDFTRAGGKQVMEAFLKAEGKNINAVYAHNDDMALGAIQAIEEAGLKPGQDVLVLSIDGGKAAVQAIVDGKIACVVECDPMLGPAAFDAVEAALAGKELPKKQVVQDEIFDATNAKDALAGRTY
jgi:simple sugar transport system substrate-binding protein